MVGFSPLEILLNYESHAGFPVLLTDVDAHCLLMPLHPYCLLMQTRMTIIGSWSQVLWSRLIGKDPAHNLAHNATNSASKRGSSENNKQALSEPSRVH